MLDASARLAAAAEETAVPSDHGQPSSTPTLSPMGPCPKQMPTEVAVSANNPFFTRSSDGAMLAPILSLPPRLEQMVTRLLAVGCAVDAMDYDRRTCVPTL